MSAPHPTATSSSTKPTYTLEDAARDARASADAPDAPNPFALRFQNKALIARCYAYRRDVARASKALKGTRRRLSSALASFEAVAPKHLPLLLKTLPGDDDDEEESTTAGAPAELLRALDMKTTPPSETPSTTIRVSELERRLSNACRERDRALRRLDLASVSGGGGGASASTRKVAKTPPPAPSAPASDPDLLRKCELRKQESDDLRKEIVDLKSTLATSTAETSRLRALTSASSTTASPSESTSQLTRVLSSRESYARSVSSEASMRVDSVTSALDKFREESQKAFDRYAAEKADHAKRKRWLERAVGDVKRYKREIEATRTREAETRKLLDAANVRLEALTKLSAPNKDSVDLYAEIDSISAAMEDLESRNAALIVELKKRDADVDRYARLRNEGTEKCVELQSVVDALKRAMHEQKEHIAALGASGTSSEALVKDLHERLDAVRRKGQEAREKCVALESELATEREKCASIGSQCDASRAQVETLSATVRETERALQDARRKTKRLKEDVECLRRGMMVAMDDAEIAEGAAANGEGKQRKQTALDYLCSVASSKSQLKQIVKQKFERFYCTVCHMQVKDTVLTTCFHAFCKGCVKKNLDSRHRKCAMCNTPFGKGDVRRVY